MSATAALPLIVRQKLAAGIRRLRLLRAVRGLSLVVLVLGLTAGGALLADHFLSLPDATRQIVLDAWVGLGSVLVVASLVVPLCRRIGPEALAAAVEQRYPHLGERLTTTVELADVPDAYHGSPALIALLARETESHARGLDFRAAFPAGSCGGLASAAAVVLLLLFAPALAWPARYAELGRRFLFPWQTAGAPTELTQSEPPPPPEVTPLSLDAATITVTPPEYARHAIKG